MVEILGSPKDSAITTKSNYPIYGVFESLVLRTEHNIELLCQSWFLILLSIILERCAQIVVKYDVYASIFLAFTQLDVL